jgi:hypothetical protein
MKRLLVGATLFTLTLAGTARGQLLFDGPKPEDEAMQPLTTSIWEGSSPDGAYQITLWSIHAPLPCMRICFVGQRVRSDKVWAPVEPLVWFHDATDRAVIHARVAATNETFVLVAEDKWRLLDPPPPKSK